METFEKNINNGSLHILIKEDSIGLTDLHDLNNIVNKELTDECREVEIDFANVTSINSSGLGILIACYKKVKSMNKELRLINLNDKLLNVFKITKLDTVFGL
ncbi:MAG: STAS domain-containing protein [Bacteroidetes bacterium]|nr:STAS domain-containing protein [Bacteroidota bacterium]MBX7046364.1 STAS domain-containing protein [Ignavibacteria bacterium]